ncbi:hypothetical protein, partial [Exiguobacterium indicum]|uniref:hypothetical protein n=1 Tax=Exiguobacterium indicum TaxID=296995 RepID=UPI000A61FCB7
NTSDSSLEFFKELIEEIMNEVESENKDNIYIILASKDYEENVRKFINIYTLSEDIKKELRNMRITYGSRFENRIMYTNKDELFGDLSYMYEFISKDNLIIDSDAVDYLENFRFLLLELEHYLMTEDDIEKEKFGVVEEIYSSLPIDIYRKNSESKKLLTFCTKKLGEILKKLNYTSG